jgi:8-amino-7-oxononanoate synthase
MGLLDKVKEYKIANDLRAAGMYHYFRVIESGQENSVRISGRDVVMLGSNNYLGLTNHPRVKEAAKAALDKYGTGCAGSRLLNGSLDIHLELEEKLAKLVRKEAALVFSTGFMVNQGVLSSMVGRRDTTVIDRTNHASIIDGTRMTFGRVLKYRHNDMASLDQTLSRCDTDGKLIVVDGVFSMHGDIAKVPEILDLAERHGATLMIDDAHGVGVLGAQGRGTADHFGVTERVHLIMGTFSKSLASVGGFIASDSDTIDYIKHTARSLIFSASMPPASCASVAAAVDVMIEEEWRLRQLWRNTEVMMERLRDAGFDTGPSQTPIIPVVVGEDATAFQMCGRLFEEGIFVNPVISPAVEKGDALIRLSLMATHTEDQVHHAMDTLTRVGRELGVV